MNGRDVAGHDGFTLAECLVAMAVIVVGLAATAAALQHGLTGIETGRGETAAVFLVEHKLEELKGLAVVAWTDTALQPGTTIEYCQPSGADCSTTPTTASVRRITTVTDGGSGGACSARCKVVSVAVFYRPLSALGQLDRERRVDVLAMFVSRA
jgi:prepilin-type N-terminal cleavage/methylation domain-containing protein